MESRTQTLNKLLVTFRGSGKQLFLKQNLPMVRKRVIKPKKKEILVLT